MGYTKLSSSKDLLENPFAKNAFGKTNTGLVTFKPNDNIGIKTNNPVLALPAPKLKFEKSQSLKDFESKQKLDAKIASDKAKIENPLKKTNWWSSRPKNQKIVIIAGSVVATIAIIYFVRKAIKK
jgi:hypothetical protein